MKIVVIGGSGLIGSKLAGSFRANNVFRKTADAVLFASRSSGVDAVTGSGVTQALAGAHVVVDVTDSPSIVGDAAFEFFETAGRNLMTAETSAGVEHHLALSLVGIDRNPGVGYFRAKLEQERLIKASGLPYTIVRSTQFFEFTARIAEAGVVGQTVHASPALVQPVASDDVVALLAELSLGTPANGTIEIAGPEQIPLDEVVLRYLNSQHDARPVMSDVHARCFGIELDDKTLAPDRTARIGPTHFEDWLRRGST